MVASRLDPGSVRVQSMHLTVAGGRQLGGQAAVRAAQMHDQTTSETGYVKQAGDILRLCIRGSDGGRQKGKKPDKENTRKDDATDHDLLLLVLTSLRKRDRHRTSMFRKKSRFRKVDRHRVSVLHSQFSEMI